MTEIFNNLIAGRNLQQLMSDSEPSPWTKNANISIPYEITIWTGKETDAGTDANVFIQMYGVEGKTEEIFLRNKTDSFERGEVDKFKIEATDIGQLQKVRIGHDGQGLLSGWFLEKMLIQKPLAQKKREARRMSQQKQRRSMLAYRQSDDESDSSS